MIKEQLLKRSPIRVLEKSLDGGLKAGGLGLLTAKRGLGKTACLVHLATDVLLRNENVMHVSFADDPHHIFSWYEEVFNEIAKLYKLEHAMDVHEELIRHRLILHFRNKQVDFNEIKKNIEQLVSASEKSVSLYIVDGLPLDALNENLLSLWREFVSAGNAAVWFAAAMSDEQHQQYLQTGSLPDPSVQRAFDVIIVLEPAQEYIDLRLLKSPTPIDQHLRLKLDPKTLLISNHRV